MQPCDCNSLFSLCTQSIIEKRGLGWWNNITVDPPSLPHPSPKHSMLTHEVCRGCRTGLPCNRTILVLFVFLSHLWAHTWVAEFDLKGGNVVLSLKLKTENQEIYFWLCHSLFNLGQVYLDILYVLVLITPTVFILTLTIAILVHWSPFKMLLLK